jgi:hypothetical protein
MIAKGVDSRHRPDPVSIVLKTPSASSVASRQERHAQLLLQRSDLTETLAASGLKPWLVFERAQTYQELGYADLAAADAYLALTLAETGLDPDHSDLEPVTVVDDEVFSWPPEDDPDAALDLKLASMKLLAASLIELGCLKDAHDFCRRLDEALEDDTETEQEQRRLFGLIHSRYHALRSKTEAHPRDENSSLANTKLPNSGFARREVYPWNDHEPDRSSPAALQELNSRLKAVAPHLEVRSTTLPVLHNPATLPPNHRRTSLSNPTTTTPSTSLQLGLFATRALHPNTPILRERSTITATRTLHASLCDNCCSPLPSLSSPRPPIPCPNCTDAVFCSPACHSLAQSLYHPVLCDNDDGVDEIGRDPLSTTPAEDLHFLLVTRALAMAAHQGVHPLDLPEVKYLWGDFVPSPSPASDEPAQPSTLPFTFQNSIVLPFRFLSTLALTHPELSPGAPLYLHHYDPWVIATLFAKCRGVASARQSTWDGRPEVAAVHPMWCLANHSCNPNVGWVWGEAKAEADTEGRDDEKEGGDVGGDSEIVYRVREKRVWKRAGDAGAVQRDGAKGEGEDEWRGIKAGEEILNHYCDVRLPVQERREWASGALGGHCMCERCVWETQQEEREIHNDVADMRLGE